MSSHNGAWRYLAESWGAEAFRQHDIERIVNATAQTEGVRNQVQDRLFRAYQMLNALERTEAGKLSAPDTFRFYLEPINHRLFEIRIFSKLIAPERYHEVVRTHYVGLDVYCRRETGLLHGVGMLEDRYDEQGLAWHPSPVAAK